MIRQHYQSLEHISAGATDTITVSDPSRPLKLTADSPAFDAMTDLRRIHPVSISGSETLEQARTTMIVCGVKLLFVRNSQGHLQGLLTANDLAAALVGAVVKDPSTDATVWAEYLETVVKKRDDWKDLYRACREI